MLFALRGLGVRTAMATGAAQRTARTAKRSRATWAPAQNVYVSTTTVPFNDTVAAAGGSPLRVPGPLPNQPNQTPETTIQLTVRYSCTVELYARSLRSRTSPPRPQQPQVVFSLCFSRSLALAPAVSLRDPVFQQVARSRTRGLTPRPRLRIITKCPLTASNTPSPTARPAKLVGARLQRMLSVSAPLNPARAIMTSLHGGILPAPRSLPVSHRSPVQPHWRLMIGVSFKPG